MLNAANPRKQFNVIVAVDGISLEFKSGEITATSVDPQKRSPAKDCATL
ncbi:MAG: hypothetical protein V3U10_05375 [Bacteroidota bacterium]